MRPSSGGGKGRWPQLLPSVAVAHVRAYPSSARRKMGRSECQEPGGVLPQIDLDAAPHPSAHVSDEAGDRALIDAEQPVPLRAKLT